jgi:hypothetical protein
MQKHKKFMITFGIVILVLVLIIKIIYTISSKEKEFRLTLPEKITEIDGQKEFLGKTPIEASLGGICQKGGYDIFSQVGKEAVIKSSTASGKVGKISKVPLEINKVYVDGKIVCEFYVDPTYSPGFMPINSEEVISS